MSAFESLYRGTGAGLADVPESGERIELIRHSTESFVQRTTQAVSYERAMYHFWAEN